MTIDLTRGFDLLGTNGKVRLHLDGSVGYDAAWAEAREKRLTLRYYVVTAKEGE